MTNFWTERHIIDPCAVNQPLAVAVSDTVRYGTTRLTYVQVGKGLIGD